jgi:hypothetical protein
MIETIAPVKKAIYKPTISFGKPSKSPIKKANFTSPKPIPLPLVIKSKNKKNANAPRAKMRLTINNEKLMINQ